MEGEEKLLRAPPEVDGNPEIRDQLKPVEVGKYILLFIGVSWFAGFLKQIVFMLFTA